MRIALFVDRFPTLSETFVIDQVSGFLAKGHEVDIFPHRPASGEVRHAVVDRLRLLDRVRQPPPPGMSARLSQAPAHIARLAAHDLGALAKVGFATFRHPHYALRVLHWSAALAGGGDYDVIYCHFGTSALLPMHLRRAGVLSGRLITVFHGWDLSAGLALHGSGLYQELLADGDLFLPVSEHWKRRLLEIGCPAARTVVHRMGVDLSRFTFQPRRRRWRTEPLRLISVARLVEKKGIEFSLRAVAALVATKPGIGLKYTIIGDGPLRKSLGELTDKLGISGHVVFLDSQPRDVVVREMQAADVLIAPSVTSEDGDCEGIPVVLVEAMATGLPVISTHHSGIPELVEDGVNGWLVPEADVAALGELLLQVLGAGIDWTSVTRAARERVEQEYSLALLNERLADLLEGGTTASGRLSGAGAGASSAITDRAGGKRAPNLLSLARSGTFGRQGN